MMKEKLEHIASALMTQVKNPEPDTNYCDEHKVYNAIGPELAISFGLELLACGMRDIKQDNFDIDYVESLQNTLLAMSEFLVKEMDARSTEVIIEELVWDIIK